MKPLSAFEFRLLAILGSSRGSVSAASLAGKAWPEARGKWFGARSGRWQRMGAIMAGLHARGFVWRSITDENQKRWTISPKGESALKACAGMTELEQRAYAILKANGPMRGSDVGWELWGDTTDVPDRGTGSHRQNKFCRAAGKVLNGLRRKNMADWRGVSGHGSGYSEWFAR